MFDPQSPLLVLSVVAVSFTILHLGGRFFSTVEPTPNRFLSNNITAVLLTAVAICTILTPPVGWSLLVSTISGSLIGWISGRFTPAANGSHKTPSTILSQSQVFWILGGLLVLAVLLRLPNLRDYGLRWDEHWHFRTALGYLKTGTFQHWDLINNQPAGPNPSPRGWFFTWQIAQVMKYFGPEVGPTRYVALLWGMLVFVPFYGISQDLNLRGIWLVLAVWWAVLSPVMVTVSRWSRFYVMYLPVYLGFLWTGFHCYEPEARWNIRWKYVTTAVILGFFSLYLHSLTLGVFPALILFLFQEYLSADLQLTRKHLLIGLIIFAGGLLGFYELYPIFLREFEFLSEIKANYIALITIDNTGFLLGGLFLPGVIFLTAHSAERYYTCLALIPVVLIMVFTHRTPQIRYILPTVVLLIPLFVRFFQRMIEIISPEQHLTLIAVVIAILIALPLYELPRRLQYIWDGNYGYIHLPGVETPHYGEFTDLVNERAGRNNALVLLQGQYFYYYHNVFRYRLKLDTVISPFIDKKDEKITPSRLAELERNNASVWVAVPQALKEHVNSDLARYLNNNYRKVLKPDRFDLIIYRSGDRT